MNLKYGGLISEDPSSDKIFSLNRTVLFPIIPHRISSEINAFYHKVIDKNEA